MKAPSPASIGIEACACLTAFGDASSTVERLLSGEVALAPHAALGRDGGDEVPLALIGEQYDETVPPRWQPHLDELARALPDEPWGGERYPVFLSSSNFDVGSLYSYRQTGREDFLKMGTPARTLDALAKRYGWGRNALAVSHACVSAQAAIDLASRRLNDGLAEKALVFSFDFVSPFVAGGFHSLKILNGLMPAPFSDGEHGSIGLGDGAAFVVLSKQDAPFRIEGNFLYNEMYHVTANEPTGSGFEAAARWVRERVGAQRVWIKGHGTGTLDAGRLEAEAFAKQLPESPLVSWKGSLGHTLGSCAAVELALALESLRRGRIPGTVGSSRPTMGPNVQLEPFDVSDFQYAALFCNAFGGAHGGCLISHD